MWETSVLPCNKSSTATFFFTLKQIFGLTWLALHMHVKMYGKMSWDRVLRPQGYVGMNELISRQ